MAAATTPKKSKGHHHVVRRNTRYAACSAGNLKHATFRPYCARAAAALAAATRSRNLKYLAIDVPSFSNTQIPLFIFLAIFAPGWDFEKDRLMRLIVGVWQHGAPRVGTRHPAATPRNEAALAREQRQQQRLHSYGKRPQRGDWTIPSPHFGSGGHFSRHGGRQRGFLGEASGKKHAMQEYDEVLRVKAMRSGGKIDG